MPRYAAISAGNNNRYGHPDNEALDRLRSIGVEVLRTDTAGTITFISDGKTIKVQTERDGGDAFAGVPTGEGSSRPSSAPTGSGSVVNINTATAAELDSLPGIGPSRAADILTHRKRKGPFKSCDSLIDIYGIGPKTIENIRPHCTTESSESKTK